jgi:hypothetical protein
VWGGGTHEGALRACEARKKNGTDKLINIKGWETRRANRKDHSSALKGWETRRLTGNVGAIKGWETRRKNGNYGGIHAGRGSVEGSKKGCEAKRKSGTNVLMALKGWETRRRNGTDHWKNKEKLCLIMLQQ